MKEELEADLSAPLVDPFPGAIVYSDEDPVRDLEEALLGSHLLERHRLASSDPSQDLTVLQCYLGSRATRIASTAHSSWTRSICTETNAKCLLPGTRFLRADGVSVCVEALRLGDELQGPAKCARVENCIPHATNVRQIVSLTAQLGVTRLLVKLTHDHRMLCGQFGEHKRAHEICEGDLLWTSEGVAEVILTSTSPENTQVYEVILAEDRPVYLTFQLGLQERVVALGSQQKIPYSPTEFVEFRFKGSLCQLRQTAEAWLCNSVDKFGLRFWFTCRFAVWVPKSHADAFWQITSELLPKGLKLYRRPAVLSVHHSTELPGELRTPTLTP